MCDEPQKPHDENLVRNLVTLWTHQNGLLWGRLQNISVLQAAIVAGWYTFYSQHNYRYAGFVTLLGSALAGAVFAAVDCDLDWRREFKKKIEEADGRLFPKKAGFVPGWKIIYGIACGFFLLDVGLLAVTIFTRLEWFGLHR